MDRTCASCEKDLQLVEELIKGYCTQCVKDGKAKWESKDLENIESKEQIASLVRQPRVIELINRLKCLGKAVE